MIERVNYLIFILFETSLILVQDFSQYQDQN